MNKVYLSEQEALNYIKEELDYISEHNSYNIDNAKYHHNSSYRDAVSICKYGILTISDLNELRIKEYTDEKLRIMSDIDSHANGIDSVSLSVVGLNDLYPGEMVYDPFMPISVDFLVSSDLKTQRFTINYGNEFLSIGSIGLDKIKSLDIRFIKLIQLAEEKKQIHSPTVSSIIDKYNYLKQAAVTIKDFQLNLKIREMSVDNNETLNLEKLSSSPKLILKK